MGKLAVWGSGPDHLTVPLIVPPLSTETTEYPLLWPAALWAQVNSVTTESATATVRNIPHPLCRDSSAALQEEQVTKVMADAFQIGRVRIRDEWKTSKRWT